MSLDNISTYEYQFVWADFHCVDRKEDLEFPVKDDSGLFDQPKIKSRPSSGRRSSRNHTPDSLRSMTPRPQSGRRSVEKPHETSRLHEQVTNRW